MHRVFLMLLGLPLAVCPVAGAETQQKALVLHTVTSAPRLDGAIDPLWAQADSAGDFTQFSPFYGTPPSEPTMAKVLATDEDLYCLIVCYQNKSAIQDISGLHDQTSGDEVSILLDTFGDKLTAYKFTVTAGGVQADARILDDARNHDYSWDPVWFSASQVYPWGYVVEMRIPFKSVRYNGELSEWGLDFSRWIAASAENLFWIRYEQNEGQRISKFGRLLLNGARPVVRGLNLEVYPVAFAEATLQSDGGYNVNPDAGIDMFYNPSEKLTFQLTGNPDFAQIEADPYQFNVSRYETYFSEQRPFFTEGNEVFMAAGKRSNSGFYSPLELFYSRRIGKVLPDGSLVPLNIGAKAFGRLGGWEYGGFLARTGSAEYTENTQRFTEEQATFSSIRLKKTILENSTIGMIFVGKQNQTSFNGVLDIDGAFRTSQWQLAYQIARSLDQGKGDYAGSVGFNLSSRSWLALIRARAVGNAFDIDQVGYVPWRGTAHLTALGGPIWYFDEGSLRELTIYVGAGLEYEEMDLYTDRMGVIGVDWQFRDNWGGEFTGIVGRSKDQGKQYTLYELDVSAWFNTSPRWNASIWGNVVHTYNFSRDYLGMISSINAEAEWKALNTLELGTSYGMFFEWKPDGALEEITYNARPFISLSPVNNLNVRLYVDNLLLHSTDRLEQVIFGFLFSYNFLPKSWIYLVLNEVQQRGADIDAGGNLSPVHMRTTEQVGVVKVKYLFYL